LSKLRFKLGVGSMSKLGAVPIYAKALRQVWTEVLPGLQGWQRVASYNILTDSSYFMETPVMSRAGSAIKRKRPAVLPEHGARKRRALQNAEGAVPNIEQLERRIAEDPLKNHKDIEKLITMINPDNPNAKTNLKAAVSLCKVFSRLAASGSLSKNDRGTQQNQEMTARFTQQYGIYRRALLDLLRSTSSSQRLSIVHLCWRALEVDAELLGNSVWVSDSIFRPLLSAVIELPGGADTREAYAGEYMNRCHDCCYYSLEYLPYVQSLVTLPNLYLITFPKFIHRHNPRWDDSRKRHWDALEP
jgi:hypothetical protein